MTLKSFTGGEAPAVAADDAIDMGLAIAIADGKASGDKLTATQKQLVEVVKEERKTATGRELTDEAARNKFTLKVNDDKNWGGYENDHDRVITVSFTYDDKSPTSLENRQQTIHHELVHADQMARGVGDPPKGLSTLDQALWKYGCEGQAYVAEEEDRRERKKLPPMTDEEKREHFKGMAGEKYAGHYDVAKATREDGRRLSEKEFEEAFGTTPGHKGNFLASGNYKDPINIFDAPDGKEVRDGTLHRVRVEEEGKLVPYEKLPQSHGSKLRVEGEDKKYVFFIDRRKDGEVNVTVYERDDRPGHTGGYVKLDEAGRTIGRGEDGGTQVSYVTKEKDGTTTKINLNIGPQDNPEVYSTIDSGGNTREYALQKVQNGRVVANNDDLVKHRIFLPHSHEYYVGIETEKKNQKAMEADVRKVVEAMSKSLHDLQSGRKGSDTFEHINGEKVEGHSPPLTTPDPLPREDARQIMRGH